MTAQERIRNEYARQSAPFVANMVWLHKVFTRPVLDANGWRTEWTHPEAEQCYRLYENMLAVVLRTIMDEENRRP